MSANIFDRFEGLKMAIMGVSGSLPSTLSNAAQLQYFDASQNTISGTDCNLPQSHLCHAKHHSTWHHFMHGTQPLGIYSSGTFTP